MRAFDICLRAPFDASTIRAAAARALGVEPDAFAEGPSPSESGLWLDVTVHPGAFRVLAEFQVDDELVSAPATVDIARALASDLGTDAVTAADGSGGIPFGPYLWLLVRPSGEILGAHEDADSDADSDVEGIVLDERPEQLHLLRAATR
jgi:hypothetical protein